MGNTYTLFNGNVIRKSTLRLKDDKGKDITLRGKRAGLLTAFSDFIEQAYFPKPKGFKIDNEAAAADFVLPKAKDGIDPNELLFGGLAQKSLENPDITFVEFKQKYIQVGKRSTSRTALTGKSIAGENFFSSFEKDYNAAKKKVGSQYKVDSGFVVNYFLNPEKLDEEIRDSMHPDVGKFKEILINQLKQKFDNIIIFEFYDKQRDNGRSFRVLSFGGMADYFFKSGVDYTKYIKLIYDQTKKSLTWKMTSAGEKLIQNKGEEQIMKDVSDNWLKVAHNMFNLFRQHIIESTTDSETADEYLKVLYRTCKEFAPGNNTPIVNRLVFQDRKGGISGEIRLVTKAKGQIKNKNTVPRIISSAVLTRELQVAMENKMPVGPVGGAPLSADILTYRTGRFVESIYAVMLRNSVTYNYNPVYNIHTNTKRNPDTPIEDSLKDILRQRLGPVFSRTMNIQKGL